MTDLWAIAAYFNPAGYERRLANYRVFRRRLAVPLVTVELSFDGDFQLGEGDADILIQLRGADMMWQKERLLNIGLGALPASCGSVAWLDCDVVFAADDWAARAQRMLEDVPLLQPFRVAYYLPPAIEGSDFGPDDAQAARLSLACLAASGVSPSVWTAFRFKPDELPAVGLAWVARREVLDRHGFYDACIVGGGDRAIIAAADGTAEVFTEDRDMQGRFREHYLAWAEAFHESVPGVGNFIDGEVFHLWHGERKDRGYTSRHRDLSRFDFDPARDIARGSGETWRWSSNKPEMHAFVRDYLLSRKEDG
jgi:hypothetical protein